MRDVARDPAALEQLREQRSRLADRMRPPWWYLTGSAVLFALAFALPFASRYLPHGPSLWPFLVAALALAWLLQWGLARATGISVGIPDLTYRPGRPARIAMLGRSVERVDMTARLLSTHRRAGGTIPSWLTLLRACGAWETYLRTYRGALDDRHAAEFLLLDRLFPRSVLAALTVAESCLTELEATLGSGRAVRVGMGSDAQRIAGRARTDLAYRSPDELIADLGPALERLERTCSRLNDAVSVRYFRQTAAVAWRAELVA